MSDVFVEQVPVSYTEQNGSTTYTVTDEKTGEVKEFTSADARKKLNELFGNDIKYSDVVTAEENGDEIERFPPNGDDVNGINLEGTGGNNINITETVFFMTDDGKYVFKTGKKDPTYGLEGYKILEEKQFIEEIKKILNAQGYTENTVVIHFDHLLADGVKDKTIYLTETEQP